MEAAFQHTGIIIHIAANRSLIAYHRCNYMIQYRDVPNGNRFGFMRTQIYTIIDFDIRAQVNRVESANFGDFASSS